MFLRLYLVLITIVLFTTPLLSPGWVVPVATWMAVVFTWWVRDDAVALAERHAGHVSLIEVVPFVLFVQLALDRMVPRLGSSLVLFGNLAAITSIVRGSGFPVARIRR